MTRSEKLFFSVQSKADAILICSPINQLYYTGFAHTDGYTLITKNNCYLITDFRYIESAKNEAEKEFNIVLFKGLNDGTVKELLVKNKIKKLMFEDSFLTVSQYEKMKSIFTDVSFVPAERIIEDMREYKSDSEAECIIKAQRIAEKAFDDLISSFDKNATEKEIAAHLEYLMKKNGADKISFDTIAVSGKASSLPHGVPRDKKIENGFLTLDFGAVYKGYHSDMTRTLCIGKADAYMKKVYSTVLTAQNTAIQAIIDGERNCFTIDKIARDIINNSGFEGCFGHGLGHGVGLEIHEAPRLSLSCDKNKTLQTGHIVTVEPGIYIENMYGVRIEDMIYMSEKGPVNITKTPKNLIEL